MGSSLTIRQARLVLPDRVVTGDLVVRDGVITEIRPHATAPCGPTIEGEGLVVLPGLVDTHVHLDALDDFGAAATALLSGGVTSAVGVPATPVTSAGLREALEALADDAALHYGLWARVGDDVDAALAARRARGLWLDARQLFGPHADRLFAETDGVVAVQPHDPGRLKDRWHLYGESDDPLDVPRAHDVDTCVLGTERALELARRHGTRAHLLTLSTAEEVARLPLPERCSAAVHPAHLFHETDAYDRLGKRAIHCPPLRGPRHRDALWEALDDERVFVASGHWPVGAWAKQGALAEVHPGWPTAEWTLPLFLDAVAKGRCTLRQVARWTSSLPAKRMGLGRKGRLEEGFDADLVLVDPTLRAEVGVDARVHTVAGWSPWQGQVLQGWPVRTLVAGHTVYTHTEGIIERGRGRELS